MATHEFCAAEVPRFNAISVAGAHFRDAGANAAQEMALTCRTASPTADAWWPGPDDYRRFRPADLVLLLHARRLLREVAKYRAGRRTWARIVNEALRGQESQVGDVPIRLACAGEHRSMVRRRRTIRVRVAYEAMASVLGGVQSMFTAAWDEPFRTAHRGVHDVRAAYPADPRL